MVDIDSISDKVERDAKQDMIEHYGQTPRQLFVRPHPKINERLIAKKSDLRKKVCAMTIHLNNL